MGGLPCRSGNRERESEYHDEADAYNDLYQKKNEKYFLCMPWPQTRHKQRFFCTYLLSTFFSGAFVLMIFVLVFYYVYFLTWVNNSSKPPKR